MARIAFLALFGASTVLSSPAAAQVSQETVTAATEAGVDPTDLHAALATVGESDPREYLYASGELQRPPPPLDGTIERRLDCIAYQESRGVATAVNRSSGASGLFQFLPSTWRTTPQGRAGLSVFDPVASRDAARWMIQQGRIREWVVVTRGLC